jgi:hypothetical protein
MNYICLFDFQVEVGRLFGTQYPCTSRAGKRRRKNNDHWTKNEVMKLVDGVEKEGIGKWSKVKGIYFSTSIRTHVHLKVYTKYNSSLVIVSFTPCSARSMKIVRPIYVCINDICNVASCS